MADETKANAKHGARSEWRGEGSRRKRRVGEEEKEEGERSGTGTIERAIVRRRKAAGATATDPAVRFGSRFDRGS